MRLHLLRTLSLWIILASLGALACDVSTLIGAVGGKPTVVIQSPAKGSQFHEGDEVAVQSTASDPNGIVRVELAVDGVTVRTDTPPIPQGQASFTLIQKWKATPGTHTLSVRAFNASGVASDPALVSITAVPASTVATAAPTAPIAQATAPPTVIGVPPSAPTQTLPGVSPIAQPTATATTRPPTATRVPPSPTVSAPPGVYAISIQVVQPEPKRGQYVTFKVTFLNTTGAAQRYEWIVKPYPPESRHAKGETFKKVDEIPTGISELVSAEGFKISGPGPCEEYIARVFWVDPNNKQNHIEFLKPDGSGGPTANFQVCP